MTNKNIISVKNLKKSFKDVKVLNNLNFSVEKGSVVALLGPNGAGKTTIIKILSTLLDPDEGEIVINGFDLSKNSHQIKKNIGLTGQYAAVDEILTARENLMMMAGLYGLEKRQSIERTNQLLLQFDLVDAADRAAKNYSGGMRRRLDLAMSLIASPPIIFLDEPTTGLDPRSRLALWGIIKDLVSKGTTILLTTQYMDEADKLANRIIVIDQGKVIAEGTANELKQKVGSDSVEIIISEESNFKKALKSVGKTIIADEKSRKIVVSAEGGVSKLKKVINNLESANIEIESLYLHHPTLDDVFLKLTGHTATQEEKK